MTFAAVEAGAIELFARGQLICGRFAGRAADTVSGWAIYDGPRLVVVPADAFALVRWLVGLEASGGEALTESTVDGPRIDKTDAEITEEKRIDRWDSDLRWTHLGQEIEHRIRKERERKL